MAEVVYNLPRIIESLVVESMANSPEASQEIDLRWLEGSWEEPEKFMGALYNYYSSRSHPPAKSTPYEHYDLYHDLVLRHMGENWVALRWYDEGLGWQELTYENLHARVSLKREIWEENEVEAGQVMCFIMEPEVEFFISLLAALKMGVLVSYLPPAGDQYIQRRLEALGPDYIVAKEMYSRILGEFEELLFQPQTEEGMEITPQETSHTWSSGEKAALLFSTVGYDTVTPREVSVDDLYLRALRDGILYFGLSAEEHFTAPSLHPLQHQPALFFSTLLTGATYVHLSREEVGKSPELLREHPRQVVGMDRALREILIEDNGKTPKNWKFWFRSPVEATDWSRWQFFINHLGMEEIPFGHCFVDAAWGGSHFISLKRKKFMNLNILPSPGVKWELSDVNLSGQRSPSDFGIYAPESEGEEIPGGTILISRYQKEWFFGGHFKARRSGRTFVGDEVVQALENLSFLEGSSLVAVPTGGEMNSFRFVLLAFVGYERREELAEKKEDWQRDIETAIVTHVSEEFLPDRYQFYPFRPRYKEEAVDHDWCYGQFMSGGLHRRTTREVYRYLAELRHLTLSAPEEQ